MSILSKIKSTKQAADQHKAAAATAKHTAAQVDSSSQPYRHVPTHAAQDALAGTPGLTDREAIQQANHDRALFARHSFYSTSSPSLLRLSSPPVTATHSTTHSAMHSASSSRAVSRSNSSQALAIGPRIDRRAHPGYHSYQAGVVPGGRQRPGLKTGQSSSSGISSTITGSDNGSPSGSSASSSYSARGYNDPIEHSVSINERLEAASVAEKPVMRTPLYIAQSVGQIKPWEVAALKKAARAGKQAEQVVTEIPVPEPLPTAQPARRGLRAFVGNSHIVSAY